MSHTAVFPHIFQTFVDDPTIESAKRVSDILTQDCVRDLYSFRKDTFVFTSLLTVIADDLKIRNQNEIKTHLIVGLTKLITYASVKSLMSVQTAAAILLRQIGIVPDYVATKPNLSEEFKLAILNCLTALFAHMQSDVVEQFYTQSNLRLIAEILSICQYVIDNEVHRTLRLSAIECTLTVHQLHDKADPNDIVLRSQIANILFILQPKIISTFTKVATGGEILGETLIVRSIVALGRVLCLVFEDQEDGGSRSIVEQTKVLIETSFKDTMQNRPNFDVLKLPMRCATVDETLQKFHEKERSTEWLIAASSKIVPIIEKLLKLSGSKLKNIRQRLKEFATLLLQRCQKHLISCVPTLLQISLTLYDEDTDHSVDFIYNENIVDLIENMCVDHLVGMTRIARMGDEDEQIVSVRLLHGYIMVLTKTNRLRITLSNGHTLDLFVTVLLTMVELERAATLLEQNNNIHDLSEKDACNAQALLLLRNKSPWKVYNNIRTSHILNEIQGICKCFDLHSTEQVIILEYLLKLLISNATSCNEALVIIQLIVESSDGNFVGESVHYEIIDELLRDFRWSLATEACEPMRDEHTNREWFEDRVEGLYESAVTVTLSNINQSDNENSHRLSVNVKDIKNNMLHMCLITETIGLYAKMFGPDFQPFILKSFHHLLEQSASVYYLVRISALTALNHVKDATGSESISDLIFRNADYITHHINVSLKNCDQIDVALRILSIVLHYGAVDSLPQLENIIETIVLESANLTHSYNILSFMKAFNLILTTIRDFQTSDSADATEIDAPQIEEFDYFDYWMSILRGMDVEEMNEEPIVENMDEQQTEEEIEEKVEEKPLLVQLTIKIMTQCIPYFASKNHELKLSALECLTIGLDIIKNYENDLLPIVHQIWTPFVNQCISDTNTIVLRYCIRLLAKLAVYAKDFIYKRCVNELLPHINQYMHALSKKPAAERQRLLYEHTQEFKVVKELLGHLPDIITSLNVNEKDFDETLNAIVWLLDENQPKSLQTICVGAMTKLAVFDRSAVYVKLMKFKENDLYKTNGKLIFPRLFC